MTQRLLLVDNRVDDAHKLCASNAPGVHVLLLDYSRDTFATLKEKVKALDAIAFSDVGFASHGYFGESYSFLAHQQQSTLKNVNTNDEHLDSWCEMRNFMLYLVHEYKTRAFYFIMCELYSDPDWVYVLNRLEEQTGTIIHATSGKIGSSKNGKGGSYIMNSSGTDLKQTFFSEQVSEYEGVLSEPELAEYTDETYVTETTADWSSTTEVIVHGSDTSTYAGHWFGRSASISGNYAIVGAFQDGPGAAYIFERDTGTGVWTTNATLKLVASDGASGDLFGSGVAISGDYAIVGAYQNYAGGLQWAGSAYIFERTVAGDGTVTWPQKQKIVASDKEAYDFFGYSVDISGDYAIVGAYSKNDPTDSGAAYIFERIVAGDGTVTWTEVKKLRASSPADSDRFGSNVAISGNYAVVGAWLRNEPSNDEGAAYIFERTAGVWPATETKKIGANVSAIQDEFGQQVDIDGDTIVVSAPKSDPLGSYSGSAYIFVRGAVTAGEWPATETQKITASDGVSGDYFGGYSDYAPNGVSIYGDTIMVGAWREHANGVSDAGSAYIFVRNSNGTWPATETQKIVANTPIATDNFGVSVAVGQYGAFVGACNVNSSSYAAGSAYIITPTYSTIQTSVIASLEAPTTLTLSGDTLTIENSLGDAADAAANGNEDKYDHITFTVPANKQFTSLVLVSPSQTGSEVVYYRIQEGTAFDMTGTDLFAGIFTDSDVTSGKNILLHDTSNPSNPWASSFISGNTYALIGTESGKDYSAIFYNDAGFSTPVLNKISGSTSITDFQMSITG